MTAVPGRSPWVRGEPVERRAMGLDAYTDRVRLTARASSVPMSPATRATNIEPTQERLRWGVHE